MPLASDGSSQEWRTLDVAARYLRRNAARTMGGSVIRGLVELITNARDSGYRLLAAGALSGEDLALRAVVIEYVVSSNTKKLIVRDRFEGMTDAHMRDRLLKYGVTASGFDHGDYVRGINARGAKDVAVLGPVKFESIHNGIYAECEIYSGRVKGPSSRACTVADRERIGISSGNGTSVTLVPDTEVSLPSFDSLAKDLDHHVEIRYHPEGQPRIPVHLRQIRDRGQSNEREIVGFCPEGELVVEQHVPLPEFAAYGAEAGVLRVYRTTDALASLASKATTTRLWKSEAGILVTDGRTAHDITFFFARGADDVAGRYLFGEVHVPQMTGLLQEYDQIDARRDAGEEVIFPELNPFQVTDPDRLGLNRDHPFVQALEERVRPIIEEVLRELEEELTPSAQERVGRELREALDRLGERLAERLDVLGTGTGRGPQVRWGLSVVPSGLRLEPAQTKRATVYYRMEPVAAPDAVDCQVSTASSAVQLSEDILRLAPVADQGGVFRGSLEVTGQALADLATVEIIVEDKSATLKLSVREPLSGPIVLERDLQFSQRHYSSVPGRRKKIELFADPGLADREVEVSLATDAIALSSATVRLECDPDRGIAVGALYVESGGPAADNIIAKCGDVADEARIVFQDFTARPKVDFRFTDVASFMGRRFRWDPQDNNRVLIAGGHPTVSRVLGPKHTESGGHSWPGQELPQTRAILAELIADAFVYRKLQESAPMLGIETDNLVDPVDYDNLRYQFFDEVYMVCHEALTPAYQG